MIFISPPIFYLGWIIQPTGGGYYVYDRQDHSSEGSKSIRFGSMKGAVRYIDKKVSRG